MDTQPNDLTPLQQRFAPLVTTGQASNLPMILERFSPPFYDWHVYNDQLFYVAVSEKAREIVSTFGMEFDRFLNFGLKQLEEHDFSDRFKAIDETDLYLMSIPCRWSPPIRTLAYLDYLQRIGKISDMTFKGVYRVGTTYLHSTGKRLEGVTVAASQLGWKRTDTGDYHSCQYDIKALIKNP